jgi:flagellar assembly factor FliW
MIVKTTRFGDIEIEDNKIVNFPVGIPGFTDSKRYFLMDYKEDIKWLQSVDNPDVAFIVMEPFGLFPDYSFKMSDEAQDMIGANDDTDLIALIMLIIDGDILYANLKSPVVINAATGKGAQVVIEDDAVPFRMPISVSSKK